MTKRLWIVYPILATAASVVYFLSGHPSWQYNVIGFSSPVAIVVATKIYKPTRRLPWYLFALGQALFIGGDVIAYNYERFFHTELPYPSIADALYLSVYPCLALGLLLFVRARTTGRDWASVIDTLLESVSWGVLSWVFLIGPNWHTEGSLLTKLTSGAYPTMDLLLLAVGIRLAIGAEKRAPALTFLMVGILILAATDSIYGLTLLGPNPYSPGSGYLEIGWIAFYVTWGMAALHPSMHTLSERAADTSNRLTWPRLAVLGSTSILAPAALGFLAWDDRVELQVVIPATVTLFLLVVARMAGVVRDQQRSASREKALRKAGAALVTATNRDSIYGAAMEAVRSLAGSAAEVRVCVMPDEPGRFALVATTGEDALGRTLPISAIPETELARLMNRESLQLHGAHSSLGTELELPTDHEFLQGSPLFMKDVLRGLIIVATRSRIPRPVSDGIEALALQVALALESAALTEHLLIKQSEARFASLVKNASDVVSVIDPDTTIRYASPSSTRVLGYEPHRLEGTRFADLVHPEDKTLALSFLMAAGEGDGNTGLLEFRMERADGSWIFVETLRTSLLQDPNVKGIVLNTRDIGERKAFEEQLSHQAFHDSVTNLANRALFRDRVAHALERQQRNLKSVAVLFMDLDDFKTINDSLGHAAGDHVLREVGERLRPCLRTADTAARLGGDEFAILLEDGGDSVQAAEVADRIIRGLEVPVHVEGKEVFVRASLGIAIAEGSNPKGEEGVEDLLRDADVAMYMAKEKGKGRYQVFETAMHDIALKRLELKADLQRALTHEEFQLHYQPVIELESGRISGVEALIRWIHPVRGLIPPLDFMPLAEETGLIVPIGKWVLHEACTYGVQLQERFGRKAPYHMAVNLSARQLQRPEIVPELAAALEETGFPPESLILEITESVMMADTPLSIERLSALKELGVKLAIDDFGTGYSSLNYVRRFPVDILKVDKSFIDGVSDGGESSALTAAVIELAGILKLKPVAEGIERADQLERLLELNCDLGQGFYFARPLPSHELVALLEERSQMEEEADALSRG